MNRAKILFIVSVSEIPNMPELELEEIIRTVAYVPIEQWLAILSLLTFAAEVSNIVRLFEAQKKNYSRLPRSNLCEFFISKLKNKMPLAYKLGQRKFLRQSRL